ncbi:MAG: extracellular solute-binding protein [Phycisphaerae bacterium]|nr:extracellular solute-binding protein [Phycisphaerae bacterium]
MLIRVLIGVAFLVVLGVPLVLRPSTAGRGPGADAPTLIVVTPHVAQIREEFSASFSEWHRRTHGTAVRVDYRTPGGTSEIVRQLQAQFSVAIRSGHIAPDGSCRPGAIPVDLMFGGGSFDHGRLKAGEGVVVTSADGEGKPVRRNLPMSVPAGFPQERLDSWFGENSIGAETLYDPDQHWIGTALSSFGIVYNKDVFARLGLPAPTRFEDLADPRLTGWIGLADPRQSGSVTTAMDAVLSGKGWEAGWRLLREMSANTRYFTNSSTKPPLDVSQGEVAAALAIDFYGRAQAQALLRPGQDPDSTRVGYVDPKGAVYIDADPISILRGGPNPELARRFVEFCLTEEAQALWQFPALANPRSASNPAGAHGQRMGPAVYELRRLPVRRVMYEKHGEHLIDKVDPFELASKTRPAGWRTAIGLMMGAFGIDNAHGQREAWVALNRARGSPGFPAEALAEMEWLFYGWPTTLVNGAELEFTRENYAAIRAAWRDPASMARSAIRYTNWFRDAYRRVVELEGDAARGARRMEAR